METQKENRQGLYLKTRNKRWKWMAGATAATAAGVTASQGSTITINLVDNYISGGSGNHLNADLTGDGHPDLTIATPVTYFFQPYVWISSVRGTAAVRLNGVYARGRFSNCTFPETYMYLGSRYAHHYNGSYGTPPPLVGAIPIFFKDLHINGGAPTRGSLEVVVDGAIRLDSFTYTSNTPVAGAIRAVPDQGSSLGLLAMGASGILALRRWRATRGRS